MNMNQRMEHCGHWEKTMNIIRTDTLDDTDCDLLSITRRDLGIDALWTRPQKVNGTITIKLRLERNLSDAIRVPCSSTCRASIAVTLNPAPSSILINRISVPACDSLQTMAVRGMLRTWLGRAE